jgi:hypothetical protein
MEKEFVPYEQALALKELGFDKYVEYAGWNHPWEKNSNPYFRSDVNEGEYDIKAPLYQQAFRWFREKYNLLGNIYSNASGWLWEIHDNIGGTHRFGSEWSGDCEESGMFTSFEKAELECLKKLIEIVK